MVTGAAGFVGTHLVQALERRVPKGTAIVRAGRERACDIAFDLTDAAGVDDAIAAVRPNLVFHLAGEASVAGAGHAAAATWRTNLCGTLSLAEAIGRHVADATVMLASSAEVYGRAFLDGPVDEHSVPAPIGVYGEVKLATEAMMRAVLPAEATLVVARPSNHVGPGQSETFVLPSFARQLARSEAEGAPAVIRVGNLASRRDFMDVRQVVLAYVDLCERFFGTGAREVVNIASGRLTTPGELLELLRAGSRVDSEVVVDEDRLRPAEISAAAIDVGRLRSILGWVPDPVGHDTVEAILEDARARSGAVLGADVRGAQA